MRKNATERFLNRTRPTVPTRVDEVTVSLQSTGNSDPEAIPLSITTTSSDSVEEPDEAEKPKPKASSRSSSNSGLRLLEEELASLPKVVNFQLRFEDQYKQQIQKVADKAGITPETLLQALWVIAQSNPSLLEEAINEGKQHHARRERARQLKPAITRAKRTLEKLGLV